MEVEKMKKPLNQRFTDFLNNYEGLKVTWLGLEPYSLSPVIVVYLLKFTSRVDDL